MNGFLNCRREDYKAVKHMDKTQMEKYLQTVYQRGSGAVSDYR